MVFGMATAKITITLHDDRLKEIRSLVAAGKAKALLRATTVHVQQLDYFYYTALTVAVLHEKAPADEQSSYD